MGRVVDEVVLRGFVDEAMGYLPVVTGSLYVLAEHPMRPEALEEANRYMHTIKGTASLLGLPGLSRAAYHIEQVLDDLTQGRIHMTREAADLLVGCIGDIATYLERLPEGRTDEPDLVEKATRICQALRDTGGAAPANLAIERAPDEAPPSPPSGESLVAPGAAQPTAAADRDSIPPELLEVFSLEAEDHLRDISSQLAVLEKDPASVETLGALRRSVHTLKGAAGAVGSQQIAQLAHRMEDLLDRLYEGSLGLQPGLTEVLFESADILGDLAQGKGRRASDRERLDRLYEAYSSVLATAIDGTALKRGRDLPPAAAPQATSLGTPATPSAELGPPPAEPTPFEAGRKSGEVVRVQLDRLDELVRLVSELVIGRSALEQKMNEFEREVEELRLSGDRLRKVASSIETKYEVAALGGRPSLQGLSASPGAMATPIRHDFDELELDRYTEFHLLSRELIEATSDIRTVEAGLSALVGEFESAVNRQGRVSSEIQDKLMRARMVPLATLSPRLHRAVRVLAREQGKLVDLVLEGEAIELDKTVMEEVADPLIHLLRNAVDHGIEAPAVRLRAGKPERGEIRLRAYHAGNRVVIQVGDDGAGMDVEALRAAAVRSGFLREAEAERRTPEELQSLTFLPGFTTAAQVSQVSGRGVGLDIVRTNIRRLKGSISLESTPGRGTLFTIRLPMTLAVMRALLVKARNETFAVPLGAVTSILRFDRGEMAHLGAAPVIRVDERVYPLIRLGEALSLKGPQDESEERSPLLIVDAGAQKVALLVDELLGEREVVVKSLGNLLRQVEAIAGATLTGDGTVVLILNPEGLAGEKAGEPRVDRGQSFPSAEREALTVLVVDDSISVRRVVSNLVRSAGWNAIAAKDGLEALEIIQRSSELPDAVLVDIEMPRMDGYELMSTLKAHPTYRRIPLLVLTSRAGEKHRQKAIGVGACDYIVKPYQDAILLSAIRNSARASREPVEA